MTHSTARDRHQLERIWQVPTTERRTNPAKLSHFIAQASKALVTFLTGQQQLRIWTKSTKQGIVWFSYDPRTEQRIAHGSEEALRTWLESRYHA